MRQVMVNCDGPLAEYMNAVCGVAGAFHPETGRGFAQLDIQPHAPVRIVAGVWFENFNGKNINMHVAADSSRRWISRNLLQATFSYAFLQMRVVRVTGLIAEDNHDSRRFAEHIGFRFEARLKDAAPNGDMFVYVMRREECRWLNIPKRGLRHQEVH